MTRRVTTVFFCLALGIPLAAVGAPAAAGSSAPAAPSQPSKVPSVLRQLADSVGAALAADHTASLTSGQVADLSLGAFNVDAAGGIGVLVHAAAPMSNTQLAQLAAAGAHDVTSDADWTPVPGASLPSTGLASAVIPYDGLDAVAGLDWITTLRPAYRPVMDSTGAPAGTPAGALPDVAVGPITAESVIVHRADDAQAKGLSGKGQMIGAMSGDVDHIADSIAQGELPKNVKVLSTAKYEDDEGTAMLEIVHDMAPKAKLAYATSGRDLFDYVEGFHRLAAAGSTVITEDLAFDDEPAFQQGLGAATAEALAKYGIWVSSSAGNMGARHAPRVAAKGTGHGPDGSDGPFAKCPTAPDNVVALSGTDTTWDMTVGIGGVFRTTLQWSEPRAIYPTEGQGGFTDLNIYVMDEAGTTCLGYSNDVQRDGVGDSIEELMYKNTTGAAQKIKIVVDVQGTSSAVQAPTLDMRWRPYAGTVVAGQTPDRAGSLNPDSNYLKHATSAAAVNASSIHDPKTIPLETYSSAGPVQVMTATRCPYPGPGPCKGVAGPKAKTKAGPTWSGADGVSVSGAGGFGSGTCPTQIQGQCRFYGTSAAAPSTAGVAALVREDMGGHVMPKKLNAELVKRAVPRDGAGYGAGVLQALG